MDADESWKKAYRAFVRENHPDRGGDPEVFARGLEEFRRGRRSPAGVTPDQSIRFYRQARGLQRLTFWVRKRAEKRRRPPRVI